MIDCQEADVLAAAMSVSALDQADSAALQDHLSSCADCRRATAEYMAAAARLPLVLEPRTPSPELRQRILRAVYAEAAQRQAHQETAVRRSFWERLWARLPASRGMTLAAAAAAVAVIALAGYVAVGRNPATRAGTVAMAVSGAGAAPSARGTLVYSPEAKMAVLTVSGLPGPAINGRVGSVYEVWLIPAKGSPVGAAYLTQGPDGRWSAAVQGDLSRYAAVAATVEPGGGSPAPTGPPVIQGSILGA